MGLIPLWRLRAAASAEAVETVEATPSAAPPPGEKNVGKIFEGFAMAGEAKKAGEAYGLPRPSGPRNDGDVHGLPQPSGPRNDAFTRHRELRSDAAPPVGRAANAVVENVATLDWPALIEAIRACRACALCKQREQAVPGVGDRSARWMFVGEGPGAEEDRRGEPFVGQAGKLLDNMLTAIGLERGKDVYIANAVKCRPPFNRTPEAAEIAACLPFLDRQVALIRPRLLVALGRPAAQALLGREISIAAARGKRFERDGVPVIVTYHPAYLLRNPLDKSKAWEDLCFARAFMEKETGTR
jgi:DNA polymerase